MPVTIYHNPNCGTSRNTLALIRHFGIDPEVVDYLKTPPSRETLLDLIARAGLSLRDVVRKKGTPYAELGLDDADDAALLDAMMAHPILINRPIVASDTGVALCRPSDVVLDVLTPQPANDAFKEEGVHFLRDAPIAANDADLIAMLKENGLPTDDLGAAGRSFFVYRTLAGSIVGYGGFERVGADALLRSVVVLEAHRGQRIGSNLVSLLAYRALRDGAVKAWILTTGADGFFTKLGYKPVERSNVPAAVLSTREASALCPTSAVVMTKKLGF